MENTRSKYQVKTFLSFWPHFPAGQPNRRQKMGNHKKKMDFFWKDCGQRVCQDAVQVRLICFCLVSSL
jgi:hypothetical protein